MAFGDVIDAIIEPFAPTVAARRRAARIGLDALRKYEAADRGRKTQGWSRPSSSADAENARAIELLRNGGRDLVRNSKYAAAGKRQIVANMVGDGIAAQAQHADKAVQDKAQEAFDRWAESRVDGFGDWYEHQKLSAGGMIEGGETLTVWRADKDGPDARIEGFEGDFLDLAKTQELAGGGRIVQGVQFDATGERTGYWMFDRHPGDVLLPSSRLAQLVPAEHVDHVFERLRFGQTRGVSWFAAVALTLRDIADIEDAVRLKKKVEACLAIVLTPGADSPDSTLPLTPQVETDSGRPSIETLRPGMILRPPPGTTVSTLIPSSSGDDVGFIRQQLAAISANLVPYHLLTGDVSQANYSSLRAALLGHWAMLDDWQQNVMIPRLCNPAFERRMRRLALETGNKKFLEVRAKWALPVRRFVDPVKDLLGEVMEIRAGLKLLATSLSERGQNVESHMQQIANMNKTIDTLGLALETDPRRLNDAGTLQLAAGYIAPKGDQSNP